MKNLLRSVLVAILFLSFTGCYTVIWSPDMEFPDRQNSDEEYSGYYSDSYYGGYYYYYDYPWWMAITPPSYYIGDNDEENIRDRSTGSLRNNDGTRNVTDERNGILDPGPPRRDANRDKDNDSNKTGNVIDKTTDSKPNNTSSRNSNNNNNNNRTRNNNGSRNSGGRR